MDERISIIIPAYNVAAHIGRCLDTILSQTYSALEIIVVNDGSSDNTDEIVAQYSSDPRLVYIKQKNAGVSAARNLGINAATGTFLAFVDSDDFLDEQMYEELYYAIRKGEADVSVCDYNLIYDDHSDKNYSGMRDEVVDISKDINGYFYKYCACPKPNNYIWTRLYRTSIVKRSGIRFERLRLGDDTQFNFKLLPFIKKVANVKEGMYNYFQRSNSNVYTAANRENLAAVYADAFEDLASYYKSGFNGYLEILPLHAYTRLRSIFFYSRLAGLNDDEIISNIVDGFTGKEILDYLRDTSEVDRYAGINKLPADQAEHIKRVMSAAAECPHNLTGLMIE